MANGMKGTAEFEHGGERYALVLDNMAWFEIEELLDRSILDVFADLQAAIDGGSSPRLKTMAAILAAGLRRGGRQGFSIEEAAELMLATESGAMGALEKAMGGIRPPAPEGDGTGEARGRAKTKRAGTGRRSSKPGAAPASTRPSSG